MPFTITRRRWLLTATAGVISSAPVAGESPGNPPRIASASLPLHSRAIHLDTPQQTRAVITAIAADPRGELVAVAGDDHTIRILRVSTLALLETLHGHRDIIRTLAFDADGSRLASAGNDGQLILWNRDNSFRIVQKMGGTPALACVRFSPSGKEMAAVGFDNQVFLIGHSSRSRPPLRCECPDLRAVAYRDDEKVLAVGGRSGELFLFDPVSGDLTGKYGLHEGRIHAAVFHRQANTVVCVGEDGQATVFDTQGRQLLQQIPVASGKLFAAAVVSSQVVAVAGSNNSISLINTDDGRVIRELTGHAGSVSTLAFNSGILFSGSFDATLRRWSIGDADASQERIAEGAARLGR